MWLSVSLAGGVWRLAERVLYAFICLLACLFVRSHVKSEWMAAVSFCQRSNGKGSVLSDHALGLGRETAVLNFC